MRSHRTASTVRRRAVDGAESGRSPTADGLGCPELRKTDADDTTTVPSAPLVHPGRVGRSSRDLSIERPPTGPPTADAGDLRHAPDPHHRPAEWYGTNRDP